MHKAPQTDSSSALGLGLAIASTALFALQFPILKLSSASVAPAYGALFESLFTLLFCFISAGVERKSIRRIGLHPALIASGVLNGLALVTLFLAIRGLDPTTVSLIGRLYFVFSVTISVFWLREPLIRGELAWVCFLLIGVFLAAFRDAFGGSWSVVGLSAAIIYPLLFAFQNAVIKKSLAGIDSNNILIFTKLWSLVPIGIYIQLAGAPAPTAGSGTGLLYIALSTFAATFLGLRLFYVALRKTSYRIANLVKALEPLFVLLFSMGQFGTRFSTLNAFGFAIILIGSAGLSFIHVKKPLRKEK